MSKTKIVYRQSLESDLSELFPSLVAEPPQEVRLESNQGRPMANTKRIPFVLNLDDPVDEAIWEIIEPLLARRRASQFIRAAVAQSLGLSGAIPVPSSNVIRDNTDRIVK